MTDDRTIQLCELYPLVIRVEKGVTKEKEHRFTSTVRIGRSTESHLQLLDRSVSKSHAEIRFEGRRWWIHDLQSRNGTFLNDRRIEQEPLDRENRLELGRGGPILTVIIESLLDNHEHSQVENSVESSVDVAVGKDDASQSVLPEDQDLHPDLTPQGVPEEIVESAEKIDNPQDLPRATSVSIQGRKSQTSEQFLPEGEQTRSEEQIAGQVSSSAPLNIDSEQVSTPFPPVEPSMTQIIKSSLDRQPGEGAGDRTIMIKRTFEDAFKRRSRKYRMAIIVGACLLFILAGVAWFQTNKMSHLKSMASELFYSTKTMELELAQIEDMVLQELGPAQVEKILKRKKNLEVARQRMAQEYEKFLEDLGVYSPTMSKQDRMILRMTRLFGESEVEMPKEFVDEVKKYIRKWQSTNTLAKAIARANRFRYGVKVSEAMLSEHMTPQFFYLGLKESAFDLKSVGPKTRFGIAKGPWQFIPTTAVEYGLQTGPLVDIERYDPRDDRHNFQLATRAAAKYLRYLYTTEAQASGLLVMASYNWGPTRVKNLIRKLPANPKERNFWQLTKKFKVPQQTKDYVYYIFSAAVIGQDPKLFGFQFQPPLPENFSQASDNKRDDKVEP